MFQNRDYEYVRYNIFCLPYRKLAFLIAKVYFNFMTYVHKIL